MNEVNYKNMNEVNSKKTLFLDTFKIALPAVLETIFIVLSGMIDNFMVSGLGVSSVAATGLVNSPKVFMMVPIMSTAFATSVIVARKKGEDNPGYACYSARIGLIITSVYSIIIGTICTVFSRNIVLLCGANADTVAESSTYISIIMGGIVFNALTIQINAIHRGSGKTNVSLVANLAGVLVNCFLDYCLIYGNYGFSRMGVAGSAIATVISSIVSLVITIFFLSKKTSFISFKQLFIEKIPKPEIKDMNIVNIILNFMSEDVLKQFSFMYIAVIAARTGTVPFASHQIGMSLLNLSFSIGLGMQIASVTLSGMAIGKKDYNLAAKYIQKCILAGLVIAVIAGALINIFGENFFRFYFDNPESLNYGKNICYFISAIIPIQVCQVIFTGTLKASGDTRYTLISSTSVFVVFNILIAVIAVNILGLGIYGIWGCTLTSQLLLLICHIIRYTKGAWRKGI